MFLNPSASSWRYEGPSSHSEVADLHSRLPDYNITPLHSLPELARDLGIGHVVLKDESNRFGLPAFKVLGASWATFRAVAAQCNAPYTATSVEDLGVLARKLGIGIITCTAGNWGRAVARMAKYMQIPVTVYVPNTMDEITQSKITSEGARVVVVDGDYDDAILAARKMAEAPNNILIMDTSWEGYEEIPRWVVEGYSTMLRETDQQIRDYNIGPVSHAVASVGVGSWAQAVTIHYKCAPSPAFVVSTEPDSAACLLASLRSGKITPIATGKSIMDGMNCGTVSHIAWDILRQGVDASLTVKDVEVHHDLQYLHSLGINIGPCGAAPLTALRRLVGEKKLGLGPDSVVVLFSTEGARNYPAP